MRCRCRIILTLLLAIATVAVAQDSAPVEAPSKALADARETDRLLQTELALNSRDLAPRTDDVAFLRRVFLDIVGVPPTPEDVLAFSFDTSEDKRARVIDRLLDDPRYGRNWARYWRDVILYRRTEERAGIAATAMAQYLTEQLNANTPWNELAASFVTATGDVRENGAAGLIMAQGGRPEDTVSELSRIFLGIQIQCAQCHNHPTDRWQREQFHQLAAFFPRVAVRPVREETRIVSYEVTVTDRTPLRRPMGNNRFRGTPEHSMPDLERPDQPGRVMQPVFFVTDDKLSLGTPDEDRREALAAWMTSSRNPWFARALVNRLWAELVGEGFYPGVDDIGPDRDAYAPETLDHLAASLSNSGYDVKQLLRTIMNTEAYQRESRNRRPAGETPFISNYAQRLRGDQLFNSLLDVLEVREEQSPEDAPIYQLARRPRVMFNQTFGYDPSEVREDVQGAIPQALYLMNSPIIERAVSAGPQSVLGRMMREYRDDEDLIAALYLKTLSRQPRPAEIRVAKEHLDQARTRDEGFADLLWALLNSADFLYRR
ncbi:MAG: DUF1549 domain-containing protein [Planctomycetales bacterium]|nr:DUF1549 domain-containing protein [Planctomycetales bacterium]